MDFTVCFPMPVWPSDISILEQFFIFFREILPIVQNEVSDLSMLYEG